MAVFKCMVCSLQGFRGNYPYLISCRTLIGICFSGGIRVLNISVKLGGSFKRSSVWSGVLPSMAGTARKNWVSTGNRDVDIGMNRAEDVSSGYRENFL